MMTASRHGERSYRGRRSGGVVSAVRPIAERLAAAHNLMVWDLRFVREAGRRTLRVSCDRVGGVTADDLALLADDLSRELDHSDAVPGDERYVLEVTSPGAERRLHGPEHFRICVGRDARVTLRDGRTVDGVIGGATDEVVEMTTDEGGVRLFFDDVARAQLVVKGIG